MEMDNNQKVTSSDVICRLCEEIVWLNQEIDRLDRSRGFFARDLICDWAIEVLVKAILRREDYLGNMKLNQAERFLPLGESVQ